MKTHRKKLHTYTLMSICTYTYVNIKICVFACISIQVCIKVHTYAYTYVCTYSYTYAYIYESQIHTYTYIYVYTYIRTNIFICTHVRKYKGVRICVKGVQGKKNPKNKNYSMNEGVFASVQIFAFWKQI